MEKEKKDKVRLVFKTIAIYSLVIIAAAGVLYGLMQRGKADLEAKSAQVQIDAQRAEIDRLNELLK